jgi:hypothetical protein
LYTDQSSCPVRMGVAHDARDFGGKPVSARSRWPGAG